MKRKVQKIGFEIKPFDNMVVFDLETTGLSSRFDDIIQIAAMRIVDGELVEDDIFFSFIKPEKPLSDFIMSYTGITEKDVKEAPVPKKVLSQFSAYCGNSLLVAHNGQAFDLPFIRNVSERNELPIRTVESIDSMHLSWCFWGRKNVNSHNLDSVVGRLKISDKGIRRHDARGDVMITAKCIQQMVRGLSDESRIFSLNLNTSYLPEIKNKF